MPPIQPKKPFDEWNLYKKSIHHAAHVPTLFFNIREVWRCSIGINVGVEEDGKHTHFERPVLVVKKFNKDMFWGVPLTSKERTGTFFHKVEHGLVASWVILSQLKTSSSKRLVRKMGTISDQDFVEVCNKIINFIEKSKSLLNRRDFSEAEAHSDSIIASDS